MTNPAAPAKIAATSVTLTRAEGRFAECGTFTFASDDCATAWARAEALISAWQAVKVLRGDRHTDKVDFVVTYADGHRFEGTLKMDCERSMAAALTTEIAFWAGQRCPSHMTAAKYAQCLTMTTPEKMAARVEFLATYAIG